MTVGSLFAGIGGFDLGLERAGMTVKWQVEIDPFCRRVLAKHWPNVRRYEDIRECCGGKLRRSRDDARCAECGRRDHILPVDVLCGGFPCQDISLAGRRAGIGGKQSGLWTEFARIIRELRPRYVLVENSSNLLASGFGMDVVLGSLAAIGYDAEWDCLPAAAFGAPHERERVWIVAYPHQTGQPLVFGREAHAELARFRASHGDPWWSTEPAMVRVVHGVSASLVRREEGHVSQIGGLGNAVVPQIPEWIGRQILAYEATA